MGIKVISAGNIKDGHTFYGTWTHDGAEEAVEWATANIITEWSLMDVDTPLNDTTQDDQLQRLVKIGDHSYYIVIMGDLENGVIAHGPYIDQHEAMTTHKQSLGQFVFDVVEVQDTEFFPVKVTA